MPNEFEGRLYVIGVGFDQYIAIKGMSEGKITYIEYDTELNRASQFPSFDVAREAIVQIQHNEDIVIHNSSIIGNILDREEGFKASEFVLNLKVFELHPYPVDDNSLLD